MEEYFAAQDGESLAKAMSEKLNLWNSGIGSNGLKQNWVKSYQLYYGRHYSGQFGLSGDVGIQEAGEQGELKLLTVNHYRNLLKHILILTTSQPPSYDCRAINTDSESIQQTKIANGVLDYYLREKRLGRYLKNAAEHALVFGKGFVELTWEPSLGRPFTTDPVLDENGMPKLREDGSPVYRTVYEGDVDVATPSVFDVYVDQTCEDWTKLNWVCIRSYKNKFDLAAVYTDKSDDILRLSTRNEMESRYQLTFQNLDESADVPVFKFYHRKTDSMPNGRYMLFCEDGTVLYDGPIPYNRLPVFRIVPGEVFGTTEGYSDGNDIIPVQEALGVVHSSIMSQVAAYGLTNVLSPNGAGLSADMLAKNLRNIKYDPNAGKPEVLNLLSIPPELFSAANLWERTAETLSGINSVARGNPDDSLKSGKALGIVQAMAVQFASGFQESYAHLFEDAGTFLLDLLKSFAATERIGMIAGKNRRSVMQRVWSGKDLERVQRVVVDLGNPLSRTLGGRIEMADKFIDRGWITTPQQYLNFIETNQIELLTEGPTKGLDLIKDENEKMMDGEVVPVLVTDPHLRHMTEHLTLLSDVGMRLNGDLAKNVLDHYMEHMRLYKTQDPLMAQMNGEPAYQGPPPQGPGPEAQSAGAPPAPPPPGPMPGEPPQIDPNMIPPGMNA